MEKKMILFKFILAMFLSFLPGIIGVVFTPVSTGENLWYNSLKDSAFTPAGWVFSAVWIILYLLIGIALFIVMQTTNAKPPKTWAYVLFGVNIFLNALWSVVFFGTQAPEIALLILMTLIIVVIFMAREFFRINTTAFWCVLPYVLWLMFAFYLNGMIVYLN